MCYREKVQVRMGKPHPVICSVGLALTCLALTPTARAQSTMECPLGLVSVGDSESAVLSRCGPPSARQTWDQVRTEEMESPDGSFAEPAVAIPQDEWVYDYGPTRFVTVLRFDNGIVRDISTGGYGFSGGTFPAGALEGPET
jgi:hypothetical protein